MDLVRQRVERPRLRQMGTQHPDRRLDMASYDTAYDRGGSRTVVWIAEHPCERRRSGAGGALGGHGVSSARVARRNAVAISRA
jgi:hypothetical protein